MLIPQYSIRWLLTLTTACAAVFSIFGLAVRGSHWAQGVAIAIVSAVVVLLVHAIVFVLLWGFSVLTSGVLRGRTGLGRPPLVGGPTDAGPKAPGKVADDKEIPATPILLE